MAKHFSRPRPFCSASRVAGVEGVVVVGVVDVKFVGVDADNGALE